MDDFDEVEILEEYGDVVTLYDDEKKPIKFYEIAFVEHESAFYAILQPAEKIEGIADDEVVVLRYMHMQAEGGYETEDNQKIQQEVFNKYLKALESKNIK